MRNTRDIELAVNAFFGLDLRTRSRERKFIDARSMYFKLCKELIPKVKITYLSKDMGYTHGAVLNLLGNIDFELTHNRDVMQNYLKLHKLLDVNGFNYNDLELKVVLWAGDKGILTKATPTTQALKTLEECHELIDAVDKENRDEVIDALGDILVTIIIQAEMQDVKLLDCLNSAYNIISKRIGKMVDGQFVKDK